VLDAEGLDEATGLYVMGPLPVLPEKVGETREDAERALGWLNGLLVDFPFVDGPSRGAALSGLFTPAIRGALECVPGHMNTAPEAGTGKSYLNDLAAGIALGDAMPVIAADSDRKETDKRIDAELLEGTRMFSIDNVEDGLGGATLCQSIERPERSIRRLQHSEGKKRKNVWGIYGTGNNLTLWGDVTRRCLLCRLDAKMERPLGRVFDRNPFKEVLADRGRYLWAALTVVRAYIVAGRPGRLYNDVGDPFEEWSDNVRSALVWLGMEDPVKTMEASQANDPVRQKAAALFQAIALVYGAGEENARKASVMIWDAENGCVTPWGQQPTEDFRKRVLCEDAAGMREAMVAVAGKGRNINPQWFGKWLSGSLNASRGGLVLRSVYDSHNKVHYFYVEKEAKGACG
jgi:putative DNA primase/helicase